jgi:hypothetical protein
MHRPVSSADIQACKHHATNSNAAELREPSDDRVAIQAEWVIRELPSVLDDCVSTS